MGSYPKNRDPAFVRFFLVSSGKDLLQILEYNEIFFNMET